ncbi:MAG: SIR2 family protein [Salinivirgaceae bacterium]|nr:SIR2 family protein [Salinivirgaceae bacterium]
MATHDPIRHLEYLRQSLSQDKKPIGFFISAGCPLSVTMPTKEEWPLIPDVANLTKWINNELKDNKRYQDLLLELEKAKKEKNNIEDILSFIRGLQQVSEGGVVRGFSESDLNEIEKAVCEKIVDRINVPLPNTQTSYHKLVKWISSIDREFPTEIFTTNYDLLMEDALDYLEVPYFDGFVGSRKSFFDLRAVEDGTISKHWIRLWKIHGSINWNQEDINGQKKIYRTSEVKLGSTYLIYPSHLKYEQSRKMPYLALIDQLNRFIREKSSLLILSGYSFNDDHLNDTIINALKANPSAMVLSLMYDTFFINDEIERYPKANKLAKDRHNLNVWTFDKAIIGTNLGDWKVQKTSDDNDIKQFITPEDGSIKLGDFAIFTDFLKMLIGNKQENKKEDKNDK